MSQTVNYKTKFNRTKYRELAEAFAKAADAVDAHEGAGTAAKSFVGAIPSVDGKYPFSFDGVTAITSKEVMRELKQISKSSSETRERREGAVRLMQDWHDKAVAAREADRNARTVEYQASKMRDPDNPSETTVSLKHHRPVFTYYQGRYALTTLFRKLNGEQFIGPSERDEILEDIDRLAVAMAEFDGPAVTKEDVLGANKPRH